MTRYLVTYLERYILEVDTKEAADEIALDHYAAGPFAPVIPEEFHYTVEEISQWPL